MFIDEVKTFVQGGNGGAGSVSFFPMKKGPCGGEGGNGGNVFIKGDSQMADLHQYIGQTILKAEDGTPGETFNRQGRDGKDLIVRVPKGTHVTDLETGATVEVSDTETLHILAEGGKGGLGNASFKSPTNQVPRTAEPGEKTKKHRFFMVLKLIADFGLIGIPSAGKSTLLNELTNANVKTAMYAFTTLEPNLGTCGKKVIADIPGLIEGASEGKGLGYKFLKHIEKVPVLLHCIAADSPNIDKDYSTIMQELEAYNIEIVKKEQLILLTKTDLVDEKALEKLITKLKKYQKEILPISIYNPTQMKALLRFCSREEIIGMSMFSTS
ncbi:MAG: GTPase ObgE [Candidatus Roizmanbacteria bacterium]|nr:GTPase ObgE [Candidatus Roizmanbacteria bacterium]